jgi:hypothetical protein
MRSFSVDISTVPFIAELFLFLRCSPFH